jgi:predicted ATPase
VGDRAAALREYGRCATVLERELGVEPLPETVALYEAVRDGRLVASAQITAAAPPVLSQPSSQPSPLADPATRAPVPLDTLFGRADELAALHGLLGDPAVRLITLTGPGGSGKTRLALELVRQVAPLFPDGVTFVTLAPLRDPALLLDAVAQAYGVIGAGAPSIAAALQRALAGRRCLLVLDNLEQLLPAAPDLADLLGALPELRLLVTSRSLLRLSGEQQFPVLPLPLPDLTALPPPDELARQPAVALLLARTQALSPQFALTPSNAAEIAALCVRLDGLPLALELAAARLRLMSAQALLRRLERPLALLSEGARNLPERQRGLRALIAWSDGLLDTAPRTLLPCLAVCAGSWTFDVAEALGRAAGHPTLRSSEGVLDALAALVDASLVQQRVGADGEPRLSLLETVRAYALERLEERGAVAALAAAHAQVYAARATAAAIPLHTADAPRWLDEAEADYPNLLAALETAIGQHDPEITLALLELLIPYWYTRGLLHEGHYWLERALLPRIAPVAQPAAGEAMQEMPDTQRLARVCFLASNLYFLQGEYGKALPYLEVCIAGWRAGDNVSWLSVALLTLAGAYALSGDAGRGAAALDEGLALVASADDPEVQAWLAHVQGRDMRHRGQPRAARDALLAAAAYYRQRGDRWWLAAVLLDLTPVLLALGDEVVAAATAAEALEAARAFKSHALVAAALNELGELARYRGELAEAEAYYTESVGLLRRIGNRADEPRLQHNLAQLALSKGELAVAAAGFADSLADFIERRIERGVMEALVGLGAVATALGATLDAARLWGAAAALGAAEQWELWPPDQLTYARAVAQARATTETPAFEAAWQAGRALSPAEVSALAQDVERRAATVRH